MPLLYLGGEFQGTAQTNQLPNFVFILTDDHRYDMLGCTGHPMVQTPNLDQLASEGILFTNAHVTSAICTPSRVSIFLSQYERKHGVNFNSGTSVAIQAWNNSYPMQLRKHGYYTGYIGKNHAPIGEGGYQSGIMEQSFDYWYAGHGHLSFYPKARHAIFKAAKQDTQVEVLHEGVEDFFSNERSLEGARHFLDQRPDDQPFCLSLCFNLPHGAGTSSMKLLDSDPEIYRTLYRDQTINLPDHYLAKAEITQPKLPPEIHFADERQTSYDYVNEASTLKERMIRSMQAVTGIDQLIGQLRQTLEEKGLADNTIIVFTSDHGLFFGEFGLGGKALCYEVNTHVPMIIYNPMVPEPVKGRISDQLVQTIDIAPTLLTYAGVAIPESYQGKPLNPLIEGGQRSIRDYIFTENLWSTQFGNPRCEAVQDKNWKYIRYYKNDNLRASTKIETAKMLGLKPNDLLYGVHDPDIAQYRAYIEAPIKGELPVHEELFDLSNDPAETTNLVHHQNHRKQLEQYRRIWSLAIKRARGEGSPQVVPYTKDTPKPSKAKGLPTPENRSSPPNVLVIVSDDQGWGDVGFNGGTDIPTPHLDVLAEKGITFQQGYVSHPYCSPSRAGLLSGRYQHRFGHENNTPYTQLDPEAGLPLGELLLSELLQKQGYQTCAIGKWHLGDAEKFWPINRGFDDWFGFFGGGMSYWGDSKKGAMHGVLRDGLPVPREEISYLTDDFSNAAVEYIDQYTKSEAPFFMYLAYNAPHGPIHATKQYLELMDHVEFGGRAAYGAMVAGMDAGIGKVIAKLKETGEYENTIIFFCSDNGGHTLGARSDPFRGHKGMLFEGGIRVPFLVSWPAGIQGGSRYEHPVSTLDIFPTVLAATGTTHPQQEKLDGVNLLPYLKGATTQKPHELLFWRYSDGAGYAVRNGPYKLVKSAFKNAFFLFDMDKDPYEQNNLVEKLPTQVMLLKEAFSNWSKGTIPSQWSDPHLENVVKEEARRQSFLDKASAGEKHR